jgi:hypothetical protein
MLFEDEIAQSGSSGGEDFAKCYGKPFEADHRTDSAGKRRGVFKSICVLQLIMPASHHTWIYLSVAPDGMHWPSRGNRVDSVSFARIPGRWIGDNEFETTDGDVMIIPPAGPDGWREGPVLWRTPLAPSKSRRTQSA